MRLNREEFLSCLEWMKAGTEQRETIEQSSCYVFKDGEIFSYNEEVACRMKSGLDESFLGAVHAGKLLEVIQKLEEETLLMEMTETHFTIKAKKQRIKVNILREAEIHLPLSFFEEPKEWEPINEDFLDGVKRVADCAGVNDQEFGYTCVHVHPEWLEATDKDQFCRCYMNTKISMPAFLRAKSIKHITRLGVIELGETTSFVHFRTKQGMVLSCKRYEEPDYPDNALVYEVEGDRIALPKGLTKAIALAEVFSSEHTDNNIVHVDLKTNEMRLRGIGVRGDMTKLQTVNYDGPRLSFIISPKMLSYIIEKFSECIVDGSRLKVDGGSYQYVTRLAVPKSNGDED